jgi:hypothetical protein
MIFIQWSVDAQKRDTILIKVGNDTTLVVMKSKIDTARLKHDNDDEMIAPEPPEAPEAPEVDEDMEAPEPPDAPDDGSGFNNVKPQKKNVKTRWVMVDYGISTYMHDGSFNLPEGDLYEPFVQNLWKSSDWNLHLFKMKVNMINHSLNLIYGLSFEFYRYNWTKNYDINPNESPINPVPSGKVYDKNRMYSSWISVPLMLNFESNTDKYSHSFHLNAGVFGSLLLASNIKREGNTGKAIFKDDFNMNQFRYGITTQIGYGPITFFVNYSLTPLFKETLVSPNKQPELFPINMGLCLIPF